MTNSQRLAAVRLRLQQWLVEHDERSHREGSPSEKTTVIRKESFLIRDGFYCGRQFEAGDHRAVWFMEEDELKISTQDGKWVCSLQGDDLIPLSDDENCGVIPMHRTPETPAAESNDGSDDQKEIRRAA